MSGTPLSDSELRLLEAYWRRLALLGDVPAHVVRPREDVVAVRTARALL